MKSTASIFLFLFLSLLGCFIDGENKESLLSDDINLEVSTPEIATLQYVIRNPYNYDMDINLAYRVGKEEMQKAVFLSANSEWVSEMHSIYDFDIQENRLYYKITCIGHTDNLRFIIVINNKEIDTGICQYNTYLKTKKEGILSGYYFFNSETATEVNIIF